MLTLPDGLFSLSNFGQCWSDMNRSRPATRFSLPGNRFREGIINFEDSLTVTIVSQLATITRGKFILGYVKYLTRGYI